MLRLNKYLCITFDRANSTNLVELKEVFVTSRNPIRWCGTPSVSSGVTLFVATSNPV